MKFGITFQLQTPRPMDAESWGPDAEATIFSQALEQIELADKLGFDYVFFNEHHFLEECCHSSAPELILAAAAARTKNIRLGHGIVQMPPAINHPARVAERISSLDILSNGRVEFGTGEGATTAELGGFLVDHKDKKGAWEEATRECLRMMTTVPYPGYEGRYFSMPERNVIPKPRQKPHPPVWVAASRRETMMAAARLGIGAIGFGFDSPDEIEERVLRYYEPHPGLSPPDRAGHQPRGNQRRQYALCANRRAGCRRGTAECPILRVRIRLDEWPPGLRPGQRVPRVPPTPGRGDDGGGPGSGH
jgi:alkanesulfonate monooxygenase SsuD/methylene tetrahydromethanopterin reductase-like flavin-dependent oxidoreductase (luciferase family)